jgi:hypothetical protein
MIRLIRSFPLLGFVAALSLPAPPVRAAEPLPERVEFDRDIRPILSNNCYACHGPDEQQRKAGLRLDLPPDRKATSPTILPGKSARSRLYQRVAAKVEAARMPPPATGKKLTPRQIELLRRWIDQGAPYERHWAFTPPRRPAVPVVNLSPQPPPRSGEGEPKARATSPLPASGRGARGERLPNPIDAFVLARLRREGLRPSPEADRATLIRRVTLDLTGLPPTPAEVDAFLADRSPDAYEKVVDRLLASPRYGERMALPWLDLARYADTHGYHIDSGREMWRWRQWVIDAFNRNLPYDQFTIEQLAGDLLPNATLEQKIASGFNRNHPINFEGGAIPEEYQVAYIADRIDTTATTWLGLTLRCTQCHDHKFDPFTQKEYYRLYAFFHNVPEEGLDGYKGNAKPFLKLPTPEEQAKLDAAAATIQELEEAQKARAAATTAARLDWEMATVPLLDKPEAVTAGLVAHLPLEDERTTNLSPGPSPERGGEREQDSIALTSDTVRSNSPPRSGAPHALGPVAGVGTLGPGERLILHGKPTWAEGKRGRALVLDGDTWADLGTSIGFERDQAFSYGAWVYPTMGGGMTVLSRMDDDQELRGWDLFLAEGKPMVHLIHAWPKNVARVVAKSGIEQQKWTHLFVTYDGSGKGKGIRIYINGQPAEVEITHDTLTETIRVETPLHVGRRSRSAAFKGRIDEVRLYDRCLTPAEVEQLAGFEAVRDLLTTAPEKRTPEQSEKLQKYYLATHDEPYRTLTAELADWRKRRDEIDAKIPSTMVMEELPKPRETFFLIRGQYDKKGEKMTPGVPAALPILPPGETPNRLTLARWLVNPLHPLTARVAVNRFWQQYFGVGLVKTAEDFGTQGERPSHPELLDWLATELIRTKWDVKALQRLIVTSATYRQSSKATPALLAKDPENRLLARAPRLRLPAEFIRDQALAVSGLLVEKIGGPSVRPYHPTGLWEEIAFGGDFSAQKYEQDHGEALYRRSMYTFWKRTCPPPSLQTFDAPEREFCIVRRSSTNTPLQALVLMNDPTYVEASRKFAERILTEGGRSLSSRLTFAVRTLLARPPTPKEQRVLTALLNGQLAAYRKDPDAAAKLLAVGESPRNAALDTTELAAWATVAGALLNLDEAITRS